MAIDVWIDTDPAVGVPDADVDDGYALVQAFHSPELHVRGIGVVFGNTTLAHAVPIAEEIAARFGPAGLGVHPGAASADDLGLETPAVTALAAALRERPLEILALGPVTNVAAVLQRHPDLAARMRRIVCVAGRRPGQLFRSTPTQAEPFPDMNFECDPAAMHVLLESNVPLLFAGWEVSSHLWITPADLERLAAAGGAASWLVERTGGWLRFWTERLGASGFNPFDTLAIGAVVAPQLVEIVDVAVEIAREDDVPLCLVHPEVATGRRAVYCTRPAPAFKDHLMERLIGRGNAQKHAPRA